MLSTYPPCPSCGEPDLYRMLGPNLAVKCADCGWHSGVLAVHGFRPDQAAELIAVAVRDERAIRAARRAT